jgi:hypothetical protein
MAGQRTRILGWCDPSAYCRKYGMTRGDLDNAGRDAERRGGAAMDRQPRTLLKPPGRRSTPAHTRPTHPAQCAYKTGRAILAKSPNRLDGPVRRLVIEATYSL